MHSMLHRPYKRIGLYTLIASGAALLIAFTLLRSNNAGQPSIENKIASPYHITASVDTTGWGIYENSAYGYSFLYPPFWRIASSSADYPFHKAVEVVNPTELVAHEDEGVTTYEIFVGEVVRHIFPLTATSSAEALGEMLSGLPRTEFSALDLNLPDKKVLILYNIRQDPNDIVAYIIGNGTAYQIALDPYFVQGHSNEDVKAFIGLYSTFKLLKP